MGAWGLSQGPDSGDKVQTKEEAGKIWGQETNGRDLGQEASEKNSKSQSQSGRDNQISKEDPGWEGGAYEDHSNPGWGVLST